MLRRSARKRKAPSLPYNTVIAASRKKPTSSAVASTSNSANLVSYPLSYNHVPVSVASSAPCNSVHVPVSVSSSTGYMGVSANITSLPQPAPIMFPQITDHSTDQVPLNTTTSGSDTGNNTYFPVQIGSSIDQMHTPHQIVGIASDINVNVSQNIKEKIKKGEYVDLASLLTNNQHIDSKQKLIVQQGELILQTDQNLKKIFSIDTWTTAFIIFTSIYCSVHPEKFQDLLKYMSMVRLGASRCANLGWKMYDEQFRLRKAQDPTSSWSSVDYELWLIYMNNIKSSPGTGNQMVFSDMQNGAQKCYNFNYVGSCFRQHCFYSHSCIRCNGGHSMLHCHSKQGQTKFQNSGSDFRLESRGFGRSRFPRNTQQFLNQNFSFRQPGTNTRQRSPIAPLGQGLHSYKQ